MTMQILLLIVGFGLMIKGADVFVDASVGIAKKLKIPTIIIGLTIVAAGTSAPEAVVSLTASIKGSNELAVGNAVGSNIFNLLLIVGLCGLLRPFTVEFKEISKDFWLSTGAAAALLLMMVFSTNYIPRYLSLILLAVFIGYMVILVRQALKKKRKSTDGAGEENPETDAKMKPLWLSIALAVFGCGLIILGGQFTVNGAVEIAVALGVSERLLGLTVVAAGTSLPELVTSLVACKKGENSIALGNVVGSNIFNILFVLGIAGIITPLAIDANIIFDLAVLMAGSLVTLLFVYTGKKVVRTEGLTMVAMYAAYTVFICLK